MLSHSPVTSSHASSGYYRSEGYYIKGSPEAEKSTQFYGKAASEAGLTEKFSEETFLQILEGVTPDGRVLGRWRDGNREHDAGIDLTFSAPKGISIAALIGGDKRLVDAHTDAVKIALDYAEANLIETRRKVNGVSIKETGAKIVSALFQHDTSRALDPQLHTHAIVANMVRDSLGTYRSFSNRKLYKATLVLGQVYRNALADKVEDLGYETISLDKGLFDIKGVPEKLVDHFSKRLEEIEASLKKKGLEPSTRNKDLAALATRASKKPVDRAELHAAWQQEVKEAGFDLAQVMQQASRDKSIFTPMQKRELAQHATEFAIAHHSERNAVYAHETVLKTALKFAPSVSHSEVAIELTNLVSNKVLFEVNHDGEKHYTDKVNVQLETDNIRMVKAREGRKVLDLRSTTERLTRRTPEAILDRKLNRTSLSDDQKQAARTVLSSRDGVVGVQGYAGTGKTYMLATASRIAQARGYTIDGLAPSHKAVAALNESVPNSATIESALTRHENGANLGDKSRSILVVDEASMMSSDGMNRVLKMARDQGYQKLVLVGDIDQLEAVGAGSAFRSLQDAGMRVSTMIDIRRQRTERGRQTVLSLIAGDVHKAMEGITDITETGGKSGLERRALVAQKLAETYSGLSAEERQNTGLIVLTNTMRRSVNDAVQGNLRARGEIGGKEVSISVLVPRHFSQAEASEIRSYRAGDIVVAPVAHKKSGLTSNTLYTVAGLSKDDNQLTLQDAEGNRVTLDMSSRSRISQRLAVFKSEKQTFITGDQVKFKITDREHGILNSKEGRITSVGSNRVTVSTKGGEELQLPLDSLAAKGMQLAYATTAHDFQGSTITNVLLGMVSKERLSTLKSFYVSVSRMIENTQLITDDAGGLAAKIHEDTGRRVNALEALAEEKSREIDRAANSKEGEEIFRRVAEITGTKKDHLGREYEKQNRTKTEPENRDENTNEHTQNSGGKEGRQLTLLDQLKRSQKTRDERSR